jgi:nucleoside-diphosphate-sugar epimerase
VSDPSTILVTGASGFIGGRLVEIAQERGLECVAAGGRLQRELNCRPGIRTVIHLAGRSYIPDSWENPLGFYETNVVGTMRVLEYCRRNAARLVHVSTYVYGPPDRLPIAEDHPTRPTTPYAHSKLQAEECCRFYAEAFGLGVMIIRPFNVYGPGQRMPFLLPSLISQMLDPDHQAVVVANTDSRRDYLFVDDFVELLMAGLSSDFTGTVNAGSGRSYSVAELYELLTAASPAAPKRIVSRHEHRAGDIMDVVADIEKARVTFGWAPRVGIGAGLKRTVEWHLLR